MNFRVISGVAATLLLAGCTDADWTRTMSYVGIEQSTETLPRAQPKASPAAVPVVQATAAPNNWCLAVATNDKNQAASNGFDQDTQQKTFVTSYTQCVAVFGDATPP
jgi:hypothetical protein